MNDAGVRGGPDAGADGADMTDDGRPPGDGGPPGDGAALDDGLGTDGAASRGATSAGPIFGAGRNGLVRLWPRRVTGATAPSTQTSWLRVWHSSLQLRIVTTTVLLGTIVVIAVCSLLVARIGTGLVDARRETAEHDSLQMYQDARSFIQSYSVGDDPSRMANDLVSRLQGPADDPTRIVLLLHAASDEAAAGPATGSARGRGASPSSAAGASASATAGSAASAPDPSPTGGQSAGGTGEAAVGDDPIAVDRASTGVTRDMISTLIPETLRRRVRADPAHQQSTSVLLPSLTTEPGGRATPAVAVGALIDLGTTAGGTYELYFVYRLDREVQTLELVRTTMIVGGVLLVLLVAGVAAIVTRQVVRPVRSAVRTAEELASGHLDRRMAVRGQDDLARLALAFNDMATSLESQIHQLENLSRVQRQFVSDVSHELRTPLTTIRMAGELIFDARDDFDPAIKRSSELLHAQLDRFEGLLGDLLEVSRFDAGAAVLDAEPIDLADLVTSVVEDYQPLVDRRGGELGVFTPDEPCVAEVDRRRVARVLRNLVGNAIEHGMGAPIQVSLVQTDDAVAIGVRDHGVGIRNAQVPMVFHRFWRADPARARTTGGTGLGLAISLEDAHLHGGWLEVWGAPKLGAHFVLTLPRHVGGRITEPPIPLVPDLPDVEGADQGDIGSSFSGRPTSVDTGGA